MKSKKTSITGAIFVGGCDRSGTTLLGAMLGSHNRCICTPESQFVGDLFRRFSSVKDQIRGADLLDLLFKSPRFNLWEFKRAEFHSLEQQMLTLPQLLRLIAGAYADRAQKLGVDLWVDHTPSNTGRASDLIRLFPNAKFIHLVRDGRAVAASIIPLNWGPRSVDRAAYFWLRNIAFGLGAETFYGESRIVRIRFEDLVAKPRDTLIEICAFLNWEFEDQMLDATGFIVPSYSRRQHALVGKLPDSSRKDAWKKSLNPREIEIFESIVGNMLSYLGYMPMYGNKAKPMSIWERSRSFWKLILSILLNFMDQLAVSIAARESADSEGSSRGFD